MVEMYLEPEIEVMWAQAGQGSAQQPLQTNLEAVHAAQKLLHDVHVTDSIAQRHQVWPCPDQLSQSRACAD